MSKAELEGRLLGQICQSAKDEVKVLCETKTIEVSYTLAFTPSFHKISLTRALAFTRADSDRRRHRSQGVAKVAAKQHLEQRHQVQMSASEVHT